MRLPVIHGLIRRRLLVNFRVDAEVTLPPQATPWLRYRWHLPYPVGGNSPRRASSPLRHLQRERRPPYRRSLGRVFRQVTRGCVHPPPRHRLLAQPLRRRTPFSRPVSPSTTLSSCATSATSDTRRPIWLPDGRQPRCSAGQRSQFRGAIRAFGAACVSSGVDQNRFAGREIRAVRHSRRWCRKRPNGAARIQPRATPWVGI